MRAFRWYYCGHVIKAFLAPVFLLLLQYEHGRSASSVHRRGTKSIDPICMVGMCVRGQNLHPKKELGRPSTSTIDEKIQQVLEMVIANRRVIIDEMACSMQIRIIALC